MSSIDCEEAPETLGHRGQEADPIPICSTQGRVRTGCLVCRKRKVKCDEQQPSCRKCSRLRRECVYRRTTVPREAPINTPFTPSKPAHREAPSHLAPHLTLSDDESTQETGYGDLRAPQQPSSEHMLSDDGITETLEFSPDTVQSLGEHSSLVNTNSTTGLPETDHMYQGGDFSLRPPVPVQFQKASQEILYCVAMDWLATTDTSAAPSFTYFLEEVNCPFITPFDLSNWTKMKGYIVRLAAQEPVVAEAVLAVQAIHRAQASRLPMSHAMAKYEAANTSLLSLGADTQFDTLLVIAFLLCLSLATIPNEDCSVFCGFDGHHGPRLEAWLRGTDQSAISLRIGAWMILLHVSTRRGGGPGLLTRPLFDLLSQSVSQVPGLTMADGDNTSEGAMFDIISSPLFNFHLQVQKISNGVADMTHYQRSRVSPEDQADVTHIAMGLKDKLYSLWESRPAPLRSSPTDLRGYFSTAIAEPLIALAGVCMAAYYAEIVSIGRILGDPPDPTTESKKAMVGIRSVVETHSSSSHDLSCGFTRPLFLYSIENRELEQASWAVDQLKCIKDPISRAEFASALAESLGQMQRQKQRRVATKYFCYQTFGVPPPFM